MTQAQTITVTDTNAILDALLARHVTKDWRAHDHAVQELRHAKHALERLNDVREFRLYIARRFRSAQMIDERTLRTVARAMIDAEAV